MFVAVRVLCVAHCRQYKSGELLQVHQLDYLSMLCDGHNREGLGTWWSRIVGLFSTIAATYVQQLKLYLS